MELNQHLFLFCFRYLFYNAKALLYHGEGKKQVWILVVGLGNDVFCFGASSFYHFPLILSASNILFSFMACDLLGSNTWYGNSSISFPMPYFTPLWSNRKEKCHKSPWIDLWQTTNIFFLYFLHQYISLEYFLIQHLCW